MSSIPLLVMTLSLATLQTAEATWEFPVDGSSSQGRHSVGQAGNFRLFQTLTRERPEKVVLWYAQRLGLGDNHKLVKQARAGFREIKTTGFGSYVIVRDTNEHKVGAFIPCILTAETAHVHMLVRPNNTSANDVAISIAQVPSGTAITVIRSVPSE